MPREELCKELKKIAEEEGVEIQPMFSHGDQVDKVKFKFSKATWADLANKEGDLLPMCCANVSTMRDAFMAAMREDGFMDAKDIQQLVINMSGHEYDAKHPATKVAQVYKRIEKYIKLNEITTTDLSDPRDVACNVWFGDVFKFCVEYGHNSMFSNWGEDPHDIAAHNLMLFQILPTVKALGDHLHKAGFPPIEGYALVNQANGRIYEMFRGLALFLTKEKALDVLEKWINTKQVKKGEAEMRTVRVSWQNGVEFIDKVKVLWLKSMTKAPKKECEEVEKFLKTILIAQTKHPAVKAVLEDAVRKVRDLTDHSGPIDL